MAVPTLTLKDSHLKMDFEVFYSYSINSSDYSTNQRRPLCSKVIYSNQISLPEGCQFLKQDTVLHSIRRCPSNNVLFIFMQNIGCAIWSPSCHYIYILHSFSFSFFLVFSGILHAVSFQYRFWVSFQSE